MADTPSADALADGQHEKREKEKADSIPSEPSVPEAHPVKEEKPFGMDLLPAENDIADINSLPEEDPSFSLRPTLLIIAAAVLGFAIGLGLSDGRGSETAISWVKLPGDLFIRALKCIVLPLVFVNIILAVIDMVKAGKASSVGWTTIGLYTLTTLLAALEGLAFILMFKSGFKFNNEQTDEEVPIVGIQCPNGFGILGFVNKTGSDEQGIACFDVALDNSTNFFQKLQLVNTNDYLVVNEDTETGETVEDDISFTETLQEGIFRKMIIDNIVGGFVDANFIGVIVFAIVFGAASQSLPKQPTVIIDLLEEVNKIFLLCIEWIIFCTPVGVISLIAGNLGEQTDIAAVFSNIGLLIGATLLAMAFHFFITYPVIFIYYVRENPFKYYKFLIPAQLFCFACASSAATLPMSLRCVKSSKQVPDSVRNFVLSMGATLNMDGGGIYFPTTIVFLAISSGLEHRLDAATYFLIVLLSTVGSAGTAPVPSAALVLIITAYNTVFDSAGTPDAFGLIFAIDWFVDRFRATLNITGDCVMARIVTAIAKIPVHETQEVL